MELFNSPIATIDYFEKSKLIRTTWKKCDNAEDFMPIILKVFEFYKILLPQKTLWNQKNFTFQIPPELQIWTDQTINLPSQKLNSFEKISFVVSRDTLSQMSLMEIFDDTACGFVPRYFIEEEESLEWMDSPSKSLDILPTELPKIIVDKQGNKIKFSVEIDSEEFDEYLYLFNKLWKARALSIDVAQRFLTLTPRENDILRLLLRGKNNFYISDALSISVETVRTHRKNIYRKLECQRIEDLMRYSSFI